MAPRSDRETCACSSLMSGDAARLTLSSESIQCASWRMENGLWRNASAPALSAYVLAELVAGLVWQPDIDADDVRLTDRQVADGGVVVVCHENVQVHLPELRAHSALQLWIVLHDQRRASFSGHGSSRTTLQG